MRDAASGAFAHNQTIIRCDTNDSGERQGEHGLEGTDSFRDLTQKLAYAHSNS